MDVSVDFEQAKSSEGKDFVWFCRGIRCNCKQHTLVRIYLAHTWVTGPTSISVLGSIIDAVHVDQ
jgi:hypothetical protein